MPKNCYAKKSPLPKSSVLQKTDTNATRTGIPNSAVSSILHPDIQKGIPNLHQKMFTRLQAFNHQIPAAEQEADRLSVGITSGSFSDVKQEMEQRLGTDFSAVRLHTDSIAAQKADEMGAKAYTTGRDIFFGSGGFQADVAAHELAHTVQQGAVPGEISVTAPIGSVQMDPDPRLKELTTKKWNWSYSHDEEYQTLRQRVQAYNTATNTDDRNPEEKSQQQMELWKLANDYIQQHEQTGKHQGRRAQVQGLMGEIDALKDEDYDALMEKQAEYNNTTDEAEKLQQEMAFMEMASSYIQKYSIKGLNMRGDKRQQKKLFTSFPPKTVRLTLQREIWRDCKEKSKKKLNRKPERTHPSMAQKRTHSLTARWIY